MHVCWCRVWVVQIGAVGLVALPACLLLQVFAALLLVFYWCCCDVWRRYVLVDAHIISTPVIEDIDGDGSPEIIFAVSYFFDKVRGLWIMV